MMLIMMKRMCLFVVLSILCIVPQSVFSYVEKNTAVVRVMDKAAGKTQTLRLSLNKDFSFDGLVLNVRNCKQSDPFDAENFFMFVEIYTKTSGRIFSGWMNRNEPGQNPLQNDVYDVWLEKCE